MQPDEQALDPAGRPRDKYRPIARIGRGGMAEVLLAVLAGPGLVRKLLVLKRPLSILTRDPDFNARFLAEARIASRLNHPNVISTFEVGTSPEGPFIVMEYLDGQPLSKVYRRLGALQMPLSYRLHVLRNLLAGLDYVHTLADFDGRGLRLVHRDVSPQNVFICYDGRVTLVDFGIAKAEGLGRNSRPGIIEGKIAYMAPEQLAGRPADHRADLFSFGVILWETLTGQRITLGAAEDEIIRLRTRGEIPDIRKYVPETPQPLVELCQRILTVMPEDRIPNATSVIEALDAFIDKMGARINDREVGQYIGHAFSAERDSRRRLIESQMALVEQGLPAVDHLPDLSRAHSPTSAGGDKLADGFMIQEEISLVSNPSVTTRATVSLAPEKSEPVATVVPSGDEPAAPTRAPLNRPRVLGLSLAGVGLVAMLVWASVRAGAPSTVAGPKPIARSASASSATSASATLPAAPAASPALVPSAAPAPARPTEAATVQAVGEGGPQTLTIGIKPLPAAASPAPRAAPAPAPAPVAAVPGTAIGAPAVAATAAAAHASVKKSSSHASGTPGASLRRPAAPASTRRTIDAENPYKP